MNFKKLNKIIAEQKLPKFREKQIRQAFLKGLAKAWDEVTVLPKELREKLAKELPWNSLELANLVKDKKEDCYKAVFWLEDGGQIESVLIRHKDGRNTVCVSSQAGCPLNCAFCATGRSGFKRNLETHEIVEQVVHFARMLKEMAPEKVEPAGDKKDEHEISNMVFMGMGEPMLNYEHVIAAVKILNDKEGLNIGARRISISTIGITDGIRKLAKENLQVNLAFSLHAPNDKLRESLCPVNKKFPIKRVLRAIDDYIEATNRRVMIEYVMLKNVNDGAGEAREVAELLAGRKLCYVNLIVYNTTLGFEPSSKEVVQKFKEVLEKKHIPVTIRKEFGREIWAACGMLSRKRLT